MINEKIKQYHILTLQMLKAREEGMRDLERERADEIKALLGSMTRDERNATEDVIYVLTDQPERCRRCGCRTEFEELGEGLQQHTCINPDCHVTYLATGDDD